MPRRRTIILASRSPRRIAIMSKLPFKVEVIPSGVDETPPDGVKPTEAVKRIALRKAEFVGKANNGIVVAADTMVELDGKLFGKPADAADNARMLTELRGKRHNIITGIAVMDTEMGKIIGDVDVAHIKMRDYSDKEVADYVASAEGMDAAGGYNLLAHGKELMEEVDGCENSIAGLPVCRLIDMLYGLGIKVDKKYSCTMFDGEPCPNTRT